MISYRFRRRLEEPVIPAAWPKGLALAPFVPETGAPAVHRLLVDGYETGGGSVADYRSWWTSLAADTEYDPRLVFTVVDEQARLAGVAVCWTTAYVKDLVVARSHRRRGLGACLLRHTFATFRHRGAQAVDLKVDAGNSGAIALYRSVGMRQVSDS